MEVTPLKRITQNVAQAPKTSARLARRTAQTTFRVTLGAVVTTEQESVRLVRAVIRRPRTTHHRPFPKGVQHKRDLETYIEDYVKYLLQLRRMPTLTEVNQLEETIGRLLIALNEVLEEKNRVKAEHAGEVPTEWMEEMVALFGRKARHDLGDPQPSADPPLTAQPSAKHASGPPSETPPTEDEDTPKPAARPVPRIVEPFRGYRTLSASQILTQIPALTLQELRKVQQYEEKHQRRATILHAVENQLAALGEGTGTGPSTEN